MSDEVRPASIPSAPLYYLYVLCWIDALGLVRRGDALRRINFFFYPLLFVLREKDVSKVIFAALFCFFIWQAEQCAMRVMAIACPLSTSRSRGCQKERRSLCHSRSSARQLHLWLSTRHFQSFPFFLLSFYRSHFPSLSLLFTWNRFIFVHPWESVFGGCVLYPWNCWEIQMAWWTIFETEMKRSSSAVPLTPLVFFHSAGHAWCPFISLRWLHQPRHGILVCLRLATIIIIVFFLFSNPLCLSCVR